MPVWWSDGGGHPCTAGGKARSAVSLPCGVFCCCFKLAPELINIYDRSSFFFFLPKTPSTQSYILVECL